MPRFRKDKRCQKDEEAPKRVYDLLRSKVRIQVTNKRRESGNYVSESILVPKE